MIDMRDRRDWWTDAVRDIRRSPDPQRIKRTIFEGILSSKLPDSDKTDARMAGEAQLIVFTGEGTTGRTAHAQIHRTGRDSRAGRSRSLPYLGVIIQETIRCHPGVMSRQMRIFPEVPILYTNPKTGTQYSVPPGTVYSMSPMDVHMNPQCFQHPHTFRPERWIENPKLSRYFIGFGRGSRNCLGIALARREFAHALASLFLKYDRSTGQEGPTMELYDTVRARDIVAEREFIVPFPAPGSQGLRVKFRC
ncbi:cytochrome p450 [Aspergillus affinis]|uniref:cytochrome p450 n=1 Tax=Aspergillus affinis TaxID=1070780 RepID=UPI0022FE533B|nr:cytochrome p450 [Aspergillus affinis]KAI9046204.1 cytochrome p450 [Aspergillus affinis]